MDYGWVLWTIVAIVSVIVIAVVAGFAVALLEALFDNRLANSDYLDYADDDDVNW